MRTLLVGAIVLVAAVFVGTAGLWPWDHDEVHSLAELGRIPANAYPGPGAQVERMRHLIPLWSLSQNAALSVLPLTEAGTRVWPALAGAAAIAVAVLALASARIWFAWALLILTGGSQMLVWLSQQNRFYSPALLWVVVAGVAMSARRTSWWLDAVVVIACLCALLTHNLTVVLFMLTALATGLGWLLGWVAWPVFRRSALAAVAGGAVYVLYLRPLLAGWVSGGTGGTSPIVSFIAQTGIVPVGLAAFGAVAAFRTRGEPALRAVTLLMVLCLGFVATAPWTLGNWNPRYALFFMVPVWFVAAAGVARIAEALAPRGLAPWWLLAVFLMLAPKLGSHFVDGSRHDFRRAAGIVTALPPPAAVLSNWPATLQYYLEPGSADRPRYWAPGQAVPPGETVIVWASNAWEPVLRVSGRTVTVVGEVGRRRFDEQSHLIRVYRVSPSP